MIKVILSHMQTDPNAPKHMRLGAFASLASVCLALLLTLNLNYALTAFFGCPFLMGLAIELVQRIQRIGKAQNTNKESLLDVLVTGFWYLRAWGT